MNRGCQSLIIFSDFLKQRRFSPRLLSIVPFLFLFQIHLGAKKKKVASAKQWEGEGRINRSSYNIFPPLDLAHFDRSSVSEAYRPIHSRTSHKITACIFQKWSLISFHGCTPREKQEQDRAAGKERGK